MMYQSFKSFHNTYFRYLGKYIKNQLLSYILALLECINFSNKLDKEECNVDRQINKKNKIHAYQSKTSMRQIKSK